MLGSLIAAGGNLIGGIIGGNQQAKMAKQNIKLQKDFAQQGIQWKVEDAKKAGIHPLYALGAQTTSFSPVSIGDSLGSGIASAGQDIGRAVNATSDQNTRINAASSALTALQLERGRLENDILKQDLASRAARLSQQINPPFPSPGVRYLVDGQSGSGIKTNPLERTATGASGVGEVGAIPDVGYARTNSGWAVTPSKDLQDRQEDDFIGQVAHAIRNRLLPSMGFNYSPPDMPLDKGEMWYFNPLKQQYEKWRP
jgi:hypothetical protein